MPEEQNPTDPDASSTPNPVASSRRRWPSQIRWFAAEYAVVVAGVLTALAATSWNQDRLTQQSERALLLQIRSELRSDSADVNGNVASMGVLLESAIALRSHLEQDLPYRDDLSDHFGALRRNVFHRFNTAAYETLKGVGLEVVSNDSLRFELAELYDGDYVMARETVDPVVRSLWIEQGYRFLGRRFRQDDVFGPATPRDYDALAEDEEFIAYLDDHIALFSWTLPVEESLAVRIDEVARAVDREIAR